MRRVLLLMLPVTISLGLINFNMLINSLFGSLVSDQSPAAIDKAFRIYQLPQGIFSVAIATVLFPTLARFAARGEMENLRATMANGMRQILFVLIPAAAAVLVLSEPMIRLVYQRGEFTPEQTTLVATALFWFAFSLPTNGLYLLQTRTFFSLQRPWMATGLAGLDLVVSALAAFVLYKPFGTGGIVAGTGIGTTAAVVAQAVVLRREFDGLELRRLSPPASRSRSPRRRWLRSPSASGTCSTTRSGAGSRGQIVSLGVGLGLGGLVYLGSREAAADRRARADHAAVAPALDARARAVPAWGRRAWPDRRVCLAWGGDGAQAVGPGAAGAPRQLATAVLAIAGLLWIAEILGTLRRVRGGAVSRRVASGSRLGGWWERGGAPPACGFFAWDGALRGRSKKRTPLRRRGAPTGPHRLWLPCRSRRRRCPFRRGGEG